MADKSEKTGKTAAGNPITTASPMGQEEIQQQTAVEQKGTDEIEERQPRKGNPEVHTIPDQQTNPRKPGVSPNTDKAQAE